MKAQIVAAVFVALVLIVGAGLVWSVGDAFAVAGWLVFFGAMVAVAVDEEIRARFRRCQVDHPTSRYFEIEPLPRSHVRIVSASSIEKSSR